MEQLSLQAIALAKKLIDKGRKTVLLSLIDQLKKKS